MSPESQHILDTLEEGEPIFILRGNDALAQGTVAYWCNKAVRSQVNKRKLQAATRHLAAFAQWAETHNVKVPD